MATYTIAQASKVWSKRRKSIKQGMIKTSFQAALYMKSQAVKLAPIKTGELVAGIDYHKTKNGYVVESTVNDEFPYNLYVNGTIEAMEYKRPNKKLGIKKGDIIAYGMFGPSHWRWTGTRGYFSIAAMLTKIKFPKLAQQNMRTALKVRV